MDNIVTKNKTAFNENEGNTEIKETKETVVLRFPSHLIDIDSTKTLVKFKDGKPVLDSSGNPVFLTNKEGKPLNIVEVTLPAARNRDDDFSMGKDSHGIDRDTHGAYINLMTHMIKTDPHDVKMRYVYVLKEHEHVIHIRKKKEDAYYPERYVCSSAEELTKAFGMKKAMEKALEEKQTQEELKKQEQVLNTSPERVAISREKKEEKVQDKTYQPAYKPRGR